MMGALALVGAVGIGEGRAVGGVCGVGAGLYECIGFWMLSRSGVCKCVRGVMHLMFCVCSGRSRELVSPLWGVWERFPKV